MLVILEQYFFGVDILMFIILVKIINSCISYCKEYLSEDSTLKSEDVKMPFTHKLYKHLYDVKV